MVVLDCSVVMAWVLPDEDSSPAAAAFDAVQAAGGLVPGIWPLEVVNTLLVAERRGRIGRSFRAAALADLSLLPISIDPETPHCAWDSTAVIAERHGLSAYDAAYLELAHRRGARLASFDTQLCDAARRMGVPVLAPAT